MRNSKRLLAFVITLSMIVGLFASVSVNAANEIVGEIKTYGNFETAGVDVKIVKDADVPAKDVSATVMYKKADEDDSAYIDGHDFVRYDGNHLATSLFNLDNDTTYDIKITVTDNTTGDSEIKYTSVKTKTEFAIPTPKRVFNISSVSQFEKALKIIKAGDELRLAGNKTYNLLEIRNVKGTEKNPIVISSQSSVRPLIKNGIMVSGCDHVILNNLEVTSQFGNCVTIKASEYCTINN